MADDIDREEAARRRNRGEARRAAAREALSDDEFRRRTMLEMEERRARPAPRPPAGPERIPESPRPSSVRPMSNQPPQRIPEPPRPSTVGTMRAAAAPAARAGSRLIPGVGALAGMMPTSLEEGAQYEREGLRRARAEQMAGERAAMDQEMGEAGSRMPTSRPARRAAPAPREISADRLNALMMGAEPESAEERVAQMRMRGRQRELEDRGTAFRKGGMVKPKPKKKMMKGGMVAKPKVAAKSKTKPMPFKKGGVIKKGRK